MSEPIVLIHSPICGPYSRELVADELRERGRAVLVPPVEAEEGSGEPFWRQHARGAGEAIAGLPPNVRPVLVGHSGSGMLLPPIRELSGRRVAAYLFADAGLPDQELARTKGRNGQSACPPASKHLREWRSVSKLDGQASCYRGRGPLQARLAGTTAATDGLLGGMRPCV